MLTIFKILMGVLNFLKISKIKFNFKNIAIVCVVILSLIGTYSIYNKYFKEHIKTERNYTEKIDIENNEIIVETINENILEKIPAYVPPEGSIEIVIDVEHKEDIIEVVDSIKEIKIDAIKTIEEKYEELDYYTDLLIEKMFEKPITIIKIKNKGFCFRPFLGGDYSGKFSFLFGTKLLYYNRYGMSVFSSFNGGGIGISRHVDDMVGFFKNIELFVGCGKNYRVNNMYFSGGLIITL